MFRKENVKDLLPILTNPDYYTIPTFQNLSKLSSIQLSKIPNFTIGSYSTKTAVKFLNPIDVRNLNIDRDVQIEQKSVTIYGENEQSYP